MAALNIRINGREYYIACDDGQEEHLRLLADEVDERVRALSLQMGGQPNDTLLLVLSSLTMADELLEKQREGERNVKEIRYLQTRLEETPPAIDEKKMETLMASTLEHIAGRIETIAQGLELR